MQNLLSSLHPRTERPRMHITEEVSYSSRKYYNEIQKLTQVLLQEFGITYFGTQKILNSGHWSLITNQPAWVEHCADKRFYLHDPSLVDPAHYQSGISYVSAHENPEFRSSIIKDAAEIFDIDHCLAFINKEDSGCEFTYFATSASNKRIFNVYLTQRPRLQTYLQFIKTENPKIFSLASDRGLNLIQLKADSYFNDKSTFVTAPEYQAKEQALALLANLAPREQECLRLLLAGLTAKQAAKKLRLSSRTIEEYLLNLKRKLGCATRHALIVKFKELL